MDEFWLWTVGNKKPQEINFNWNVERESYEPGLLAGLSPAVRLRPWKNDYILLFDRQVIIDSKTMTISDWSQVGENAWTTSCHDFWWSMGGGVCLMDMSSYVTLLSEKGDTLGSFAYTWEKVTYYSSGWFPDRSSLYWIFGKRDFIDSLRNITRY